MNRRYDYTVELTDPKGRTLKFRDILGSDLEYLDHVFKYDPEDVKKKTSLSFEDVCDILVYLNVSPDNFRVCRMTRSTIGAVFEAVRGNIIYNYLPKVIWLRYCYGIQNASFVNLSQMETVPMSKFLVMVEIHKEAIAQINNDNDTPDLEQ